MNKITLTGNLVNEHLLKQIPDNKIILSNTIAVNRKSKKKKLILLI